MEGCGMTDKHQPVTLRSRVQEITTEYWEVREQQFEQVAVAQMAMALARAEAATSRQPLTEGLDVERLAAALDVLSYDGLEYDLMAPEEREERDDAAARLVAEYARLPRTAA
jgi:hypothetical protein